MRNLCVLTTFVVLAACASANPVQPIAKVQNVVYRVDDQAQKPASAKPDEGSAPAGTSKPMHIYWFF
jgi:hypothetical protein